MPSFRTLVAGAGKMGSAGATVIVAAQVPIVLYLAAGMALLMLVGGLGMAMPAGWGRTEARRNASFRVIKIIAQTIRPAAFGGRRS